MKLPGRTIGRTLEQQLAAPYLAVRTAYCQAVATAVRTECHAPGARLVVSHWPSCHTRTRTEPAEADHDEQVGLAEATGMPPRPSTRGHGRSRTMAVTTTIDSPAAATNTTPVARRRG